MCGGRINSFESHDPESSRMSTDDPLLYKQLGDYAIIDLLGQGGMARIYRGYDPKLDRYAAVKVIDSSLAASQDADEYRERFLREARAIARLRHPNIVNIYQFGEVSGTYYMAMAFLEGRDLRQILYDYAERGERMPYSEVFPIVRDIAAALDYAHRNDVIHRDVKPSNIMVTAAGAVLMDFGLALHVPEGTTGNIFGTAHYIAPEQAVSSASAVPQSDLYSLGIVIYEMLAGHVPFDDPSAMSVALKHISEPPPPPRRFNPNLSPEVESVLLRALEKEPQDRFPNGAAMVQTLEGALNYRDKDDTIKDPPSPPLAPPPLTRDVSEPGVSRAVERFGSSNIMWTVIGVGVVVVILAALLLLSAGGQTGDPNATQTALVLAAATETMTGTPAMTPTVTSIAPTTSVPPTATAVITPTATIPATPALAPIRNLTARSGPGSQYPSVGAITAGEQVDIIGISEDGAWFQVSLTDGSLGWVSASPALVTISAGDLNDVPIVPAPTDLPSATPLPTITPTRGLAPTTVSAAAEIILYYDPDNLVLLNRSDQTLDLSRLTFVQTPASGRELVFDSDRWQGNDALPSGDWPKPTYCDSRRATAQVGSQSWFWISDDPGASFQVVIRRSGRADEVLATCQIDAGQCEVSLSGGSSPVVVNAPTAVPTERPSSTPQPADTATERPTESPTAAPGPTVDASAPVLLTWDAESLVLLNRSSRAVDVSGLTFIQITPGGRQLSFESQRWEGGGSPTGSLPAGDCFQVWRDSVSSTLPVPEGCDSRRAWQAVGSQRWFWVSSAADAAFEVRRGSRVLAECAISVGECAFDPGEDEAASTGGAATTAGQIETSASTAPLSASVLLTYNDDSLVLYNGTNAPVDVSGLTFVQVTSAGDERSFLSDRWDRAAALLASDCLQVWRDGVAQPPEPGYCDSLLSWQIVTSPRWFWVSDDPNATFRVRRGDQVLAECRVGDGQCTLNLSGTGVAV
jgi:serine/threonine protein kinase